jgi:glycosyltransferase involved in cell wall biosynthesis
MKKRWAVAFPGWEQKDIEQKSENVRWLDDFVDDKDFTFYKVGSNSRKKLSKFHNRKSKYSSLNDWLIYFFHAIAIFKSKPDGIVTVFPQLAIMVGIINTFRVNKIKHIAWCFNVEKSYSGIKGLLSRYFLKNVKKLVVHSSEEVAIMRRWLNLDMSTVIFVHYQSKEFDLDEYKKEKLPMIVAMGSSRRDYLTFFQAVDKLDAKVIVIAADHALPDTPIPKNIQLIQNISHEQCNIFAKKSWVNVIPLKNTETAAGQVTVVESLMMGCVTVATDTVGTRDYIDTGFNGFLVKPDDSKSLHLVLNKLLNNESLRVEISENAQKFALEVLSDRAATQRFIEIVKTVSEV